MAHEIFHASRALQRKFSDYARARRMREFRRLMSLDTGLRVLDLGGTPYVWQHVPDRCSVTIVNLPGETHAHAPSHHDLRFIEADACSLPQFADRSFEMVFSNSVIEHVGDEARQEAFANEVRRLGQAYWVQTPSKWFPVEAHTAMPFWWFYPAAIRRMFLRQWRRKLPLWSDAMAATRVLTRERLQALFPEARMYVEWVGGIPKSYAAYVPRR
jgi:hypothetical protein